MKPRSEIERFMKRLEWAVTVLCLLAVANLLLVPVPYSEWISIALVGAFAALFALRWHWAGKR